MSTKIYIAASYRRKDEMRALADRLEMYGHEVVARWINGAEEGKDIEAAAAMDFEDVCMCDTLIFIGEPQGSEIRGGGRWWEFGAAYALDKRCIAWLNTEAVPDLGDRTHLPPGHESVFTALGDVMIVKSYEELVEEL